MKSINTERGFTLVELLIASTVFSVIMILCTFALISVGRSYYKGVTVARTQEVARTIMDEITQAIQFSGGTVVPSLAPASGVEGFCIDKRRYSYIENNLLQDLATNHAFVVDDPGTACSSGVSVQPINNAGLTPSSREFLLPNMRIAEARVSEVVGAERLYRVSIKVVSGDNDSLENVGTSTVRCRNAAIDSQFCSVAELTSVVQKRLE